MRIISVSGRKRVPFALRHRFSRNLYTYLWNILYIATCMLDIVSCIVRREFIRALRARVCVFTVPFSPGCTQEFAVRQVEFGASFAKRVLSLRVYGITGIPRVRRELITTFRPVLEHSSRFVAYSRKNSCYSVIALCKVSCVSLNYVRLVCGM